MAEILGIISSAITIVEVAGKLGASTIRLKRLWDEVQNVPASIQRCIDQLELLGPAIDDMDIEFQKTRDIIKNDTAAKRSIEYSRKAIETLETLVRDMEKQINSAKRSRKLVAQLKVRIKREVIEEHRQQLNSALQLVFLSQQTYLIALSRLQPEIIVSQIRDMEKGDCQQQISNDQAESVNRNPELDETDTKDILINGLTPVTPVSAANSIGWRVNKFFRWQEPSVFGGFAYQVDGSAGNASQKRGLGKPRSYFMRLQLPGWMIRKAWDLQVLRAPGGWTIQLKNWNTRPFGSDIFRFVMDGRIDLTVDAIRNNEASLYDINEYDITLVEMATACGHLELAKTLDIMGLPILEINPIRACACIMLRSWQDPRADEVEEFCDIYMHDMIVDASAETDKVKSNLAKPFKYIFWGAKGAWRSLISTPEGMQKMANLVDWFCVTPVVPLDMLSQDSVTAAHFRQGSPYSFGRPQDFAWRYFHAFLNLEADWEDWRLLARKLFVGAAPKEVALPSDWQISTVAGIIRGLWQRQFALRPFEQFLKKALAFWLEDLFDAGVDLEEYMLYELIGSRCSHKDFETFDCPTNLQPGTRLSESGPSLVVLTPGKAPNDWDFLWDPCLEELVGEFWSYVDCPKMIVPGAWVDDELGAGGNEGCHMCEIDVCHTLMRQEFWRGPWEVPVSLKVRGMTSCEQWTPEGWITPYTKESEVRGVCRKYSAKFL